MSRSKIRGLLKLIYFHNPFYLISACLFVYGLKLLFRPDSSAVLFQRGSVSYMEPWGLLAAFAAVTLLMTVIAIVIVRLGKVWEDARSLVLIVLLMLLAISVCMDELFNVLSERNNARQHLLLMFATGVGFALGTCELLIRGLKLKLHATYRLPLYGFLTLFFLWPALLLPELTGFSRSTVRWLIPAFPVVAAVITLVLIPAVKRGSNAVAVNGTPWTWPLFPWTPFVFIALAVCFRAYSFTMSYDPLPSGSYFWDTTFGLYQLTPFLLAIATLLLEMGIVERRPRLAALAMFTGPVIFLLANPAIVPWKGLPAYVQFTQQLTRLSASPVYVMAIALTGFYAFAWSRKVRGAEFATYGMIALISALNPNAPGRHFQDIWATQLNGWPALGLAVVLVGMGIQRRQSFRVFVGLCAGLVSVCAAARFWPQLMEWQAIGVWHAVLLMILMVGQTFRDEFAGLLDELSPPGFVLCMASTAAQLNALQMPWTVIVLYVAAMTLTAVVLSKLLHRIAYLYIAAANTLLGVAASLIFGLYTFTQTSLPPGAKPVILAAGSFLVAVFISTLKAGLSRRIRMCWITRNKSALSG